MQIAKYSSTKETINNFFRNTGYNEQVNLGDMAFWVHECMGLINAPLQYIPKVKGHVGDDTYDMESYRVELPCDFHDIIAVSVDGNLAVPGQGFFHQGTDMECCGGLTDRFPQEEFLDNFGNIFSPQALPLNTRTNLINLTYTMNDSFITFNVETGQVCLAYWAFPLDEEGFPLIPDKVKYKRAVYQYLQYKVDYLMWRQDLLTDKVYKESKDEWEWAVASAIGELKMPDVNQMEGMRRQSTKMIVRTEEFRTGFANLNTPGHRGRY